MNSMGSITAIVGSVITDGPHGPFAFASSKEIDGSVTFSLSGNAWEEDELPTPGDRVVLENIKNRRAGWRAGKARFFGPQDQNPEMRTREMRRESG